jgi:hypothetical protein
MGILRQRNIGNRGEMLNEKMTEVSLIASYFISPYKSCSQITNSLRVNNKKIDYYLRDYDTLAIVN